MMKDALQEKFDAVTQLAEAVLSDPITTGTDQAHRLSAALEELYVLAEQVQEQETALSETHAALQAEHRRYVDLFDFCPDAYLVTDVQGLIQEANAAAARMLGRSQDALAGKPIVVFIKPSERPRFRIDLGTLLHSNHGRLEDKELQLTPDDRTTLETLVTAVRTRARDGAEELRWLIRDVTHWKELQGLVREMDTPILSIAARALLMPIIGVLDAARMANIEERLLARIAACRARNVIVDVTGVPQMDGRSAELLVSLTHTVRLLGARLIIAGVSTQLSLTLAKAPSPEAIVSLEFVGDLREAIARTFALPDDGVSSLEPERHLAESAAVLG